jgi:hypothetical protein
VQEAGEEVGVVDSDGELEEDVLISEFRLEDAAGCVSLSFLSGSAIVISPAYLSLVNLPSLYAVMKLGLSLYALSPRLPAELLDTSKTSATDFSSEAFW